MKNTGNLNKICKISEHLVKSRARERICLVTRDGAKVTLK